VTPEERRAYAKAYYAKNRERIRAQQNAARDPEENKRRCREYYRRKRKDSEWLTNERQRLEDFRKNNLGKYAAKEAKRRAAKMERTVSWADLGYIRDLYENAKEANEIFINYEISFHIDHEIPLQGELVSGLHVENNLQVLSAYDNLSKSNRYEVNNYALND